VIFEIGFKGAVPVADDGESTLRERWGPSERMRKEKARTGFISSVGIFKAFLF
jgi:hypothetical protein